MKAQFSRLMWRILATGMLLAVSVNFVLAQEEAEAAAEGGDVAGPMIFVLLLGVGALIAVGGAIASQESTVDDVARD